MVEYFNPNRPINAYFSPTTASPRAIALKSYMGFASKIDQMWRRRITATTGHSWAVVLRIFADQCARGTVLSAAKQPNREERSDKNSFRDAKQYWGLEDFMNVKETAVTNAANLASFMVNVSQALLRPFRQNQPDFSILDLKSYYRGYRYARETIKMLPQKPDANFLARIFEQNAHLGARQSTISKQYCP